MAKSQIETPKESVESLLEKANRGYTTMPKFGSPSPDFNFEILGQIFCALGADKKVNERTRSAIHGMAAIAPQNEIEGMLAAQMVGAHYTAMQCLARAALKKITVAEYGENLAGAAALMQAYAALMDALSRYRNVSKEVS